MAPSVWTGRTSLIGPAGSNPGQHTHTQRKDDTINDDDDYNDGDDYNASVMLTKDFMSTFSSFQAKKQEGSTDGVMLQ